jgi:hypothetical protein
MMETSPAEDYEYITFTKNRFRFLGNGFSAREDKRNGDPIWYLDRPGDLADIV